MELSAVDPWGAPASAATVGSAGPSPPPMVSAPGVSGPWGTASTDPWGVASPTSPNSTDPWGGGAPPPSVAPPPDPWGETNNAVNNVDPWGSSGKPALQPVGFLGTSSSPHVEGTGRGLWTCSSPHRPILCKLPHHMFTFMLSNHSVHAHMLPFCNGESKHAERVDVFSPSEPQMFYPLVFTQGRVATTALV